MDRRPVIKAEDRIALLLGRVVMRAEALAAENEVLREIVSEFKQKEAEQAEEQADDT